MRGDFFRASPDKGLKCLHTILPQLIVLYSTELYNQWYNPLQVVSNTMTCSPTTNTGISSTYHFIRNNIYLFLFLGRVHQGHIVTGSLRVEEPVHTSWLGFCTVNHRASASNYQFSNMEVPGPRFEPATSEVEGDRSNCYTTEPTHMQ